MAITIFQPAANDQSIYYLSQIFPGLNTVLNGAAPVENIVGNLFLLLNSAVLTVAGFMVTYTIVLGLIATAHEGEFLGRKFDKIWTPFRVVLGIAGLVPMSSGYSAIQVIMMWVIVQGIGLADTMWTTSLNYASKYGIMGTAPTPPDPPKALVNSALIGLFEGLVCQESARNSNDGYYCNKNTSSFCTMSQSDLLNITSGPQVSNPVAGPPGTNSVTYSMGPGGACGTLKICNDTTPQCVAQRQVLQTQIVPLFDSMAAQLVGMDNSYNNFVNNSYQIDQPPLNPTYAKGSVPSWLTTYCSSVGVKKCCAQYTDNNGKLLGPNCGAVADNGPIYTPTTGSGTAKTQNKDLIQNVFWKYGFSQINSQDFIDSTRLGYNDAVKAAAEAAAVANLQTQTNSNSTFQTVQKGGWIFAGALYFTLANSQNKTGDSISINLTLAATSPNTQSLNGFPTNVTAADQLIYLTMKNYVPPTNNAAATDVTKSWSGLLVEQGNANDSGGHWYDFIYTVWNFLNDLAMEIMSSFVTTLTGSPGSNPLLQVQALGHGILVACDVIFWVTLAALIAAVVTGAALSVTAVGTGDTGIAPSITSFIIMIIPMFFAFITVFVGLGGLLAVYVPLIPFVVFSMGALGWIIGVIEAMVAGPLVALGVLSPSANHHEILGKAEPALGLIFGLFLRPGLMVFGMVISMLFSIQAVNLINFGFLFALNSTITASTKPGLIELILYMGAYTMLIVSVMNKCFSLITVVPEKVLVWISIQAQAGGADAQEALSGMKGGVEGAGAGVKGGVSGAESKVTGAQKPLGDILQADKAKAEAAKAKAQSRGASMTGKKEGKE